MEKQHSSASDADQSGTGSDLPELELESHEFRGEVFEEIALSEDEGADEFIDEDDEEMEMAEEFVEEEVDAYDMGYEDEEEEILLDTEPSGPDNSVLVCTGLNDLYNGFHSFSRLFLVLFEAY